VEAVDKVILDPSMTSGVQEVEEGNDGEGVFTYTTKYVNGKKKGTEREVKEWITEPHDNVLRLGTSSTGHSGEYVVTKTFTANTTAYTAGAGARGALGQSVHVGTCAVDPGFVSLRSELWVEGYGYAYANDTGGAVKGNVVDLYMSSRGQCVSWGRRNVTAYVIVPEGD
jgi:3D (Asp-Asp-Asp) domain-containing protein